MTTLVKLNDFLKNTNIFQHIYFVLFAVLLISMPFAFSTDTRSVFEIHKLTFLRVSTILLCLTYIYECLFTSNIKSHDISIFGIKWKKTNFEFQLLFIIVSLLISTFFSENIRISLVGTYDRWEGLWTSLNYLVLFFLSIITIKTDQMRITLFI